MTTTSHHRVLIVGGGTAGITVAARLRRGGIEDVAIVEPSDVHHYQPLWTVVGAGLARPEETARPTSRVVPRGVTWIRDRAAAVDPENRTVTLGSGDEVEYDRLVVAPGIQLDWDRLPGLETTLGRDGVSSNYAYELAPKTWEFIRSLTAGRAIFTAPSGSIKCPGAPQKIAYLAADWWRRQGVLDRIEVVLVLPGAGLFGIPEFARTLERVVARYGIDVRLESEVTAVDADDREVVITHLPTGREERLPYDLIHVVPPQSAPDWLKASPLSDGSSDGWVEVDPVTLRHPRHPEVFALGDACGAPTSKTGAAVRKQAPVVVDHLVASLEARPGTKGYDGYSSCPFTTARGRVVLAEFDYEKRWTKTVPLIDTSRERYDMWLLKRYGLPWLYWNLMLRGLA